LRPWLQTTTKVCKTKVRLVFTLVALLFFK